MSRVRWLKSDCIAHRYFQYARFKNHNPVITLIEHVYFEILSEQSERSDESESYKNDRERIFFIGCPLRF